MAYTGQRDAAFILICMLALASSVRADAPGDRKHSPFAAFEIQSDSLPRLIVAARETTSVRGAVIDGIPLLPLAEVLAALGVQRGVPDTGRAASIRFPAHTARLLRGNPFVVITETASGSASLLQLSAGFRTLGGRWYIPVHGLATLLRGVLPLPLHMDSLGNIVIRDSAAAAPPFDVQNVDIEQRLNGYLMTIRAPRKLGDVETWLKPDGWLFVTIEGARADTVALKKMKPYGAIRQLLVFQSPSSVQLTFKVAADVEAAEVVNDPSSNDLFVSLRTRSASEQKDLDRKRQALTDRTLTRERNKWQMDVIVIDAGHGGKDPGTIGVGKVYEKTVTLSIALKLGALVKKHLPGVKVVYTRSTDKFVELYRRAQIANEAGGNLFISIHCNSMEKKPSRANGFEIYLLRPGRTDDAVRIAARENASIQLEDDRERYKELTEEQFILVTMAQSAYMKHSENFAEIAAATMDKHLTMKNGGVKQAGFYVLVGASMPNALIETGYLSNKKDEAFLKSSAGQQKIAEAVLEGIRNYKEVYERSLREGFGSESATQGTNGDGPKERN